MTPRQIDELARNILNAVKEYQDATGHTVGHPAKNGLAVIRDIIRQHESSRALEIMGAA